MYPDNNKTKNLKIDSVDDIPEPSVQIKALRQQLQNFDGADGVYLLEYLKTHF